MPEELPETEAVVPTVEATPAPVSDGPWSSDLAGLPLDDAGRAAVDSYLREKIQPRMTQFEQEAAAGRQATELISDFRTDPRGTYAAVGEELFGEGWAEKVTGLWEPDPVVEATATETPAPLDPRVQALIEEREASAQRAQYEAKLAEVTAANADIDPDLLPPFIVSAEGDWDKAVEMYRFWDAKVVEKHGITLPEEIVPGAPAALGTTPAGGGTAPIPVQERYDSIDAALDATLAESRAAKAPTTVGSI